MNFFIEGIQGSGKSTLVGKLSKKYPEHRQELELRICREVFEGRYTVFKSKGYDILDV